MCIDQRKRRTGIRFVPVLFCVAAGMASAQIASSGSTAKEVKNSFFVRSVDLLFPGGTASLLPESHLNDNQTKQIEKEVGRLISQLAAASKGHASDIEGAIGRPVLPNIAPTFRLAQGEQPTANTEPVDKKPNAGMINIGLSTLRMNLVIADNYAIVDNGQLPHAYAALIKQRDTYRGLKGGTRLGDAIRILKDSSDDRWDSNFDAREEVSELQESYTGALVFVLAHEIGHIALGHLREPLRACSVDPTKAASNEFADGLGTNAQRMRMELEADFYAGMLSALLFNRTVTIIGQTEQQFIQPTIDTDVFLEKGLRLAGFETDGSCGYPPLESRKGAVTMGVRSGLAAADAKGSQNKTKAFDNVTVASDALQIISAAWEADPKSFVMSASRGSSNQELATESLNLAMFAIELDSSKAEAYVVAGWSLALLKQRERAEKMFGRAIQLTPAEQRKSIEALSREILDASIDANFYVLK